jgi:transcriptional regulator with XRE-family HTH domain
MQTTSTITRSDDLRVLGQAINQIRRERGMSSRQLADRAGIPHERLHAIQTGQEDPGYQLLRTLAAALGIPSQALMRRVETLETRASTGVR